MDELVEQSIKGGAEHPAESLNESVDLNDLDRRIVNDGVSRTIGVSQIEFYLALEPADVAEDRHVILRCRVELPNTTELSQNDRISLNQGFEGIGWLWLQTEFE